MALNNVMLEHTDETRKVPNLILSFWPGWYPQLTNDFFQWQACIWNILKNVLPTYVQLSTARKAQCFKDIVFTQHDTYIKLLQAQEYKIACKDNNGPETMIVERGDYPTLRQLQQWTNYTAQCLIASWPYEGSLWDFQEAQVALKKQLHAQAVAQAERKKRTKARAK